MVDAVQSSKDVIVQARLDAACELYQSCITKSRDILEASFGKPTSYYDGEKRHVLDIASSIFSLVVRPEDIEDVVCVIKTKIENLSLKSDEDENFRCGEKSSTSNSEPESF